MATYWLGFFAPNIDPNKEVADLQALEAIVHTNSPGCEMMEHVIALKSLALRSRKTVTYWASLRARPPMRGNATKLSSMPGAVSAVSSLLRLSIF